MLRLQQHSTQAEHNNFPGMLCTFFDNLLQQYYNTIESKQLWLALVVAAQQRHQHHEFGQYLSKQ